MFVGSSTGRFLRCQLTLELSTGHGTRHEVSERRSFSSVQPGGEQVSKPVFGGNNAHPAGMRRSFYPDSGPPFFDRSPATSIAGLRFGRPALTEGGGPRAPGPTVYLLRLPTSVGAATCHSGSAPDAIRALGGATAGGGSRVGALECGAQPKDRITTCTEGARFPTPSEFYRRCALMELPCHRRTQKVEPFQGSLPTIKQHVF